MTMSKEENEKRKNTVTKLLKKGLTVKEIAEMMEVSKSTIRKDIKRFGLKANNKRQSFKMIGDKVLDDYQKGCKIGEIAKKYDRKEESVRKFIYRHKYYKTKDKKKVTVRAIDILKLKGQSDLYKNKLDKVRCELKIGENIKYKEKIYTVIKKYERFVLLQGKEYQITAMYGDFVKTTSGVVNG